MENSRYPFLLFWPVMLGQIIGATVWYASTGKPPIGSLVMFVLVLTFYAGRYSAKATQP